jgi:hypothetical protein
MNRWLAVGLLGVGLGSNGESSAQDVQQVARANGWLEDYAAARKSARQSRKPLFVVFRCQP